MLNFLLGFINEEWKISSIISSAFSGGSAVALSEWIGLESEYGKSRKRNEQNQDYGKKEK